MERRIDFIFLSNFFQFDSVRALFDMIRTFLNFFFSLVRMLSVGRGGKKYFILSGTKFFNDIS